MHLQPVHLAPVAQATLEYFDALARDKHILLKAEIEEPLPMVRADADKMKWVLQQLLDNALKFTQENGEVHLHLSCENNLVNVRVCDTGKGIPEEQIELLFTPFHSFDRATATGENTYGLSLAMAHYILKAHGTSIHVESKVGHGSCFSFTLPAYNPDEKLNQKSHD